MSTRGAATAATVPVVLPPALEELQQARSAAWAELDHLAGRPERHRSVPDTLRFLRLHRQAVGDLALVRARWPDDALAPALAELVAASAAALGEPNQRMRRNGGWLHSVRLVAAHLGDEPLLVTVSAAALVVPLVLVIGWGAVDPIAAARLVPTGIRRSLGEGEATLPVGAGIGALAFAASAAGGVPGIVVLAWLGAVVGALPAAAEAAGGDAPSGGVLLLALVPLLVGVVVAAAAGLRVPVRSLVMSTRPARSVASAAGAQLLVAAPLLVLGSVMVEVGGGTAPDDRGVWAVVGAGAALAYLGVAAALGARLPDDR